MRGVGQRSVRYIGMDLHKELVVICIIDKAGKVLQRQRCPCTREGLEQFGRRYLYATDKVALEATTNTWEVVAILKPFVAEVVVSNPLKTKAIAEAKIKTDKVDAEVLAQLLRCDFLPRVWEPPTATQQLRRATARRTQLVADKTAIKNRIHAILHQRLIKCPFTDLFCQQGRQWLQTLLLDTEGRAAIDSDLRVLEVVETEIAQHEHVLATHAYDEPQVKLLMTLPGVSLVVAQTLWAVLGEVERFRDADHAASYLGLVPSTHQSGRHCYHGPITKEGHRNARSLLVQAAQSITDHPGPLGAFFRRIAKRRGHNVAVVATARKLVVIAWHMLKANEPYRYARPQTVEYKLEHLRVQATGEKRKLGVAKGTPRSMTYGSGQRRQRVRSLTQVCERAMLPLPKTVEQLPTGEVRMLNNSDTLQFVQAIQHEQLIMRQVKTKKEKEKTLPGSTAT
jgi:transposase